MSLRQIIATIRGSRHGLDKSGNPVWNRTDGSQMALDMDSAGVPQVFTRTAAGVEQLAYIAPVTCTAGSTSAAAANRDLIQYELDVARLTGAITEVVVHGPGRVIVDRVLEIPSQCKLTTTPGTYITRAAGKAVNWNVVVNRQAHRQMRVNTAVVSGGVCTVIDPGHPYVAGDLVYNEGYLGNTTLNGAKTVLSVVAGVSWTFAATGSNPTNTSVQLAATSRYNPLAGSNFVRSSNVVTVTETGHTRQVGDAVYIAGIPVVGTSFNGAKVITTVTAGVSWTYASTGGNETGTGTAQLLGDRNIEYDLQIDGNNDGVTYGYAGNLGNFCTFGNITGLTGRVREAVNTTLGRVVNHYNAVVVRCLEGRAGLQSSVLFQFDSFCDKVRIDLAQATGTLDDTVAWGVTDVGFYTDTVSPTGPGNMGRLSVGTIMGTSPTGLFKFYCATGYDIGHMSIDLVAGTGAVTGSDANTGVSGGTFQSLTIGTCELLGQVAITDPNCWSSIGEIKIGKLTDRRTDQINANNTGEVLYLYGPVTSVSIDEFIGEVARTQSAPIKITASAAGARVRVSKADTTCGVGGYVFLARGGVAGSILQVDSWTHSGAGNTAGTLVYSDVGGDWSDVFISKFRGGGFGGLVKSNTTGGTRFWYLSDCVIGVGNTVGIGVGSDATGTFNIWMTNVDTRSNMSNNLVQFGLASQTVRVVGAAVTTASGKFALAGASQTLSINCLTALVAADLAGLVPQAGDVINNTNSALGTLGQAGPVIRRGSDSKWVLLADTTKTS